MKLFKIITLISFLFITKTSLSQIYEVGASQNKNLITLIKNKELLSCRISIKYEFLRLSTDNNFVLLRFSENIDPHKTKSLSGLFDISDAYEKCKNGISISPILVPYYEIITDANKKSELYSTGKEDIYSIGGNAKQVFVRATVRLIENSQEVIFPFSVLKFDSMQKSMRKSYLDPLMSEGLDEGFSRSSFAVFSLDGQYIAPEGIICATQESYSGAIFLVTKKKKLFKHNDWLSTENGVEECRRIFGVK